MPFLKVCNNTETYTALDSDTDFIYDLQDSPNHTITYGLAIQAVYENTDTIDATIRIQASNDGENWFPVVDPLNISDDGMMLWDLGTPFYKYIRVHTTFVSGSMDLQLIFCGTNLS